MHLTLWSQSDPNLNASNSSRCCQILDENFQSLVKSCFRICTVFFHFTRPSIVFINLSASCHQIHKIHYCWCEVVQFWQLLVHQTLWGLISNCLSYTSFSWTHSSTFISPDDGFLHIKFTYVAKLVPVRKEIIHVQYKVCTSLLTLPRQKI